MATFLKTTANLLVGLSVVKLLSSDLASEIRRDSTSFREKATWLVRKSPYRAAGLAAAAGAVTGMALAHRRAPRTIPTRL